MEKGKQIMADFDEYEYEGKLVKVPKGSDPSDELLDSLSQEQDKIQKQDEHLAKRQDAYNQSELAFPRASKAMETILKPIAWAGEKFDRIGGAPTRSAIMAMQDGKGLQGAVYAFGSQFGEPSEQAPTGRDIMLKAGVSGDESPRMRLRPDGVWEPGIPNAERPQEGRNPDGSIKYAGLDQGTQPGRASVLGFGVDVLADPTNLLGVGTGAKMLGKGGMVASSMAARGTTKAVGVGAEIAAKTADLATGTKAATSTLKAAKSGVKSLEGAYKTTSEALKSRFGTKLAPDFEKSLKVAQDNGIDPDLLPESVTFGPNSSASRMARVKAEGPLGQPLLEKHDKGLEAVKSAIKKDIRAIGGEVTQDGKVIKEAKVPTNSYAAGELIKKSYDDGVDRAFSEIGNTHNKIIEVAPDLHIDQGAWEKLNENLSSLKEYASKRAKTGITNTQKEQGNQLLNAIENIEENSKTYSGMVDALRDIGDIAFKSKNVLADIPPDIARFRGLYNDLNKTLVQTVKANESFLGAGAADDLLKSNKKITEMYGDKSLLSVLGDEGKSSEKLFKGLIIDGDAQRINTLKKYLTPEQVQQVKAAALNTLIKENPQGEFTFKMLHNSMRNKKDVLSALFTPGELDNINNLVQLGDKFGPAVMSTSGTGASNSFNKLITAPLDMAEKTVDMMAASKQKAEAKRVIGFDLPGMKQAAKGGENPPIMSLSDRAIKNALSIKNPRGKASQAYYSSEENKEKK